MRAWIDGSLDDGKSLWVAERGEELLGFAVVRGPGCSCSSSIPAARREAWASR